jgi:four helix bundle protein
LARTSLRDRAEEVAETLRGFCRWPAGSASELEYRLLLARDLDLLKIPDYQRLSDDAVEVKRMLASLMQKLRAES